MFNTKKAINDILGNNMEKVCPVCRGSGWLESPDFGTVGQECPNCKGFGYIRKS